MSWTAILQDAIAIAKGEQTIEQRHAELQKIGKEFYDKVHHGRR